MIRRLVVLGLLYCGCFAATITSSPATVYLDSNFTSAAKSIAPHPVWTSIAGAEWVSVSPCTGSQWSKPGCEVPNLTWHRFYTRFVGGGPAVLTVAADDTLNLDLDGNRLYTAAQGGMNLQGLPACASVGIGCVTPTVLRFDTGPGEHKLMFDVYQGGGIAFGLAFSLQVTPAHMPEPASLGTVAGGLAIVGFALRRSLFGC